jgi:hypothetical protein
MNPFTFVVNLAVFSVPGLLLGTFLYRLSRSSRDEWQLLAWVPVLPLALWAPFIAWGVTRDPTSHNLWPFELVTWILLSGAMLVLFLIGRSIMSGRERS